MNLIDIKVTDKYQKVTPAQMVVCEQCHQSTFRILVINGHNHLECTTCGESYCQGGCDHGCKDDSCDQSHCAKCGSHMMGGYLPHGTVCETCQAIAEMPTCRRCHSLIDSKTLFCINPLCFHNRAYQDQQECPTH